MPNVISSAIVNAPPPDTLAVLLNRRNKIHHLDPETDEDMIPIFTHDVNGKARNNKRLLNRRNWCSIRLYDPELLRNIMMAAQALHLPAEASSVASQPLADQATVPMPRHRLSPTPADFSPAAHQSTVAAPPTPKDPAC
jgi:hypothetical protein